MYISQVFSAKSKRVYAIVCAIVLLLLFQGAFQENNNETEIVMKDMINQIGELPTFALTLVSFAFFLFPLFFIVKVFHNQSITQFTTSRKKVDFKAYKNNKLYGFREVRDDNGNVILRGSYLNNKKI